MQIQDASLSEETQKRYLNYALSVVTSRALPDVRDGLKPVQRRILYGMHRGGVRADGRYVKCARVVGEVMGKYHPHGDSSIYDALVRMAQPFTLRVPLVDGQGNFGNADGDGAAAMRYTECKLSRAAGELLNELDKDTVDFRPNYDGVEEEPVVLPARFPNLLVNGSSGIAVGMATSIPPHNLGEVIDATIAVIDEPDLAVKGILKFIKGPDFPTGGQVISTKRELEDVYTTGQGSVKVRGTWKLEEPAKGNPQIIITSIPYAVERKTVVEKIAEVIIAKKLPVLLDVRDESTDETRVVCEIKKGTDPQLVMAYLFKHTPLSTNVQVNLTCLVPVKGASGEVPAPERLDLKAMLRHFLDFRMQVVVRRLGYDLKVVQRRIHILEGFVTIFDALDETIRIIRKSQNKADAAEKLMKRFELSAEQVDAILELRLYRLAQLEINIIREELEEKRKEAKRLQQLLSSEAARWKLIRAELLELKTTYADRRATKIVGDANEPEYDAEAFIIEEDAFVLLSQQGWVKRQGSVKDLASTRVREGDAVQDVVFGSTKASVAFFSNFGACYVCRIVDVQATTGYGNPVQTMFKLADGERIVKMLSFDPRQLDVPPEIENAPEPQPPYALAVTKGGMCMRFSLRAHREPSTRAGRKYVRLTPDFPKGGDEVVYVDVCRGDEKLACATAEGHALVCMADEVPILAGAGKGVKLIKIDDPNDAVLGARLMKDSHAPLVLEHENGKTYEITVWTHLVARGNKGSELFKRGRAVRVHPVEPTVPSLEEKG
ncbi:DNA gyrase/topoisomerase IV subunit A [Sandaracinus amylolyticus]|uniref:DNA topoisomerase (ATP-hydrolyzing) n=1 Tax=Sandaracinus amylolyticus TaxID=927083 RepID=A0A0F6YIG2_9BACT|nr:DNA topoisomerase IV subunit A [Sandaracinus amylolyticus]AKF06647.1 Topoisomerase IV subunit A [Sandaracinus amylolyticus]